jgi:translation initiation factor 3 subunit E
LTFFTYFYWILIQTFVSSAQQLQQRAWLLHWTLFVCFDHEQNRPYLLDLFLQDKYLNTIQVACPHLLRYLVAAAIANKTRRRNLLSELAQIVDAEQHTFRDPVTEFLRLLLVEFDFDGAQRSLKECERLCAADFFLSVILADFMEGARTLLLETYLKIHTCVSLSAVTQRFEQSTEQIQTLIASMQDRLPATIDTAADQIQIGNSAQSVYQQVLDKAKPLVARTQALAVALDRRERNAL